jgi:hypothetical protein
MLDPQAVHERSSTLTLPDGVRIIMGSVPILVRMRVVTSYRAAAVIFR